MRKIIGACLAFMLAFAVGSGFLFEKNAESPKNVKAESESPVAENGKPEKKYLKREEIPIYSGGGLDRLGILKGSENGYELEREVTRAETVAFIARTLGTEAKASDKAFPFEDIKGHWAEQVVGSFYAAGYINGTSETTFSPDRTVTGREFLKILLCAMGYENITLENAAEKGKEAEVLMNNFTNSVVLGNYELLRSDVLRICHSTLTAKLSDGKKVYESWIENAGYSTEDFDGILWGSASSNLNFSDKLNTMMPTNKNYVISPISLKMALMLAANGAEGETKDEILTVFGVENLERYNEENRLFMGKYDKTDVLDLLFANSAWINETNVPDMNFSKDFLENAKRYFAAESIEVNGAEAVKKINAWVSEKTNGKISVVINKPDFAMMLINAVYFNAGWENEFEEQDNTMEIFYSRDGSTKEITFMNNTDDFDHATAGDISIIELPYSRHKDIYDEDGKFVKSKSDSELDLSMYILMGEEKVKNAAACIENAEFKNTKVKLSIPKFKAEYTESLKSVLQKMGIEQAFEAGKADFSLMVEKDNAYIGDVTQKAIIEVNEKGTEAAAVTVVNIAPTAALQPETEPIEFRADKPFTFVVRDNTSGEILFMGEYAYAE